MNNRVGFQGRLRQPVRVMIGGALVTVLAACGGSGSSSSQTQVPNSFIYASQVLGHSDYSSSKPNQTNSGANIAVGGAGLNSPTGAIATNGTLFYIADTQNSRILGYTTVPTKPGQAADFVIGQGQANSSGSKTTNSPTTTPTGLAFPNKVSISDDGKLIVADTGNNRVLIWNTLPTSNVQADVVIGQADFNSGYPNGSVSATAPSQSSLSNPTAATIANGRLFVVDNNNNRVLIWNTVPTQDNAAADVVWGQPNFVWGVANCGQGTLIEGSSPAAYDCSQVNYSISQFSLYQPRDLWTDGYQMMVADSSNNRVLYWPQIPTSNSPASAPQTVMGQGTFTSGASGGTSQSAMSNPYSVSSDGAFVYVADTSNNRVLVFSGFPKGPAPGAYTVLGQNYWNFKTANDDNQDQQQDSNPSGRTLNLPTGVFAYVNPTNGASVVYVSDSANNRVLQFTPSLN